MRTVTEGRAAMLCRIADGGKLRQKRFKGNVYKWVWIIHHGKHEPLDGLSTPQTAINAGLIAVSVNGALSLSYSGRALVKAIREGKVKVETPRVTKSRVTAPPKPKPAVSAAPKPETPKTVIHAPAATCSCGTRKTVCPDCSVQFCQRCEPERNGVCSFCEEDKRMTRREPSKTFGVEARIALRMGRR